MTKHPRAKCILAALLSALLLLSSLAVALPVAAATGAAYHWNFGSEKDISTYHKNYWKTDGPSATNNRIVADRGVWIRALLPAGTMGPAMLCSLRIPRTPRQRRITRIIPPSPCPIIWARGWTAAMTDRQPICTAAAPSGSR